MNIMTCYPRLSLNLRSVIGTKITCTTRLLSNQTIKSNSSSAPEEEEFRVFDVRSGKAKKKEEKKLFTKSKSGTPREKKMKPNQDWPSVWPGARTFHPAVVPLPVRQGRDKEKNRPPMAKYANAELMKLANFLHLTPPAITRHCAALKQFCTPWPKELKTDEDIDKHFPLEVTTTDYCFSSARIRDPKARIVSFKFKLSELPLDKHAADKIKRLLRERYDAENDIVTLVTDRCPTKKQNYDYNQYLLKALYFESLNVEPWESEKTEEDMEYYDWEKNKSKEMYLRLKSWPEIPDVSNIESICLDDDENAQQYKEAVSDIFNKGDSIENIFKYKEAVMKLVF